MKRIILLLLLVTISLSSFSRDLIGTGIGRNKVEAKKNALDDLSTQIEVSVESLFYREENTYGDDYEKVAQSVINLRANNVLLGVDYKVEEIGDEYSATAIISEASMGLYENKVFELEDKVVKDFSKGKDSDLILEKKNLLNEALRNSARAETYRNIAFILGSNKNLNGVYTLGQIANELDLLESEALDKAVVHFNISGEFEDDGYRDHLHESLNKVIASLANRYQDLLIIGDEEFNNIIIDTKLNSSYMEYLEPVYYNNKKLTDAMYKASITITFIVRDTFEGSVKGSFVVSTSGKSFDNEIKAMEKAISLAVRDSKYRLENYIEPFNYQ